MVLEINHKLAGIVPMANTVEQEALTKDIEKRGQVEPIVLWQGKIIDGRCRNLSCIQLGIEPKIKELPWNTTEEEAMHLVKSLNTRRNLTSTQKIMSACRVSLDARVDRKVSDIAKEWGVSFTILKNARTIASRKPEFIEPLFNGESVKIISSDGNETLSNKVSAIYAYIKREEENSTKDESHGWKEDANIKTQAGKDWYYEQIKGLDRPCLKTKMMMAELANYKFTKES